MQATPIRRAIFIAGTLLCACIPLASAQTTPDQLEAALKGKRFALRNFSADQTVKAKWANDGLVFDPPALSTFGVFAPGSVKLKGTTLTIAGERSVVLLDGKTGKPGVSDATPTWLQIDLGAADPAAVIPKLQSALFFPDIDSAASSIPQQFSDLVPYRLNPADPQKLSKGAGDRGGQWFLVDGSWKKLPIGSSGATAPKPTHFKEPEYTEQARQLKVQGSVILAFVVSDAGKVETPWLLKPFGYGMDESAAAAARQITFASAQVAGKPAAATILYDCSFKIIQ